MARKICVKCRKRKNNKSFPKHIRYKDGYDTRCKSCVKKASKVRNKLHKVAIEKPDCCPVCKKKPENFNKPYKWHLDHDPKTHQFRGWLCEPCNMSLGLLGDNVEGIVSALNYLLQAKLKNRS